MTAHTFLRGPGAASLLAVVAFALLGAVPAYAEFGVGDAASSGLPGCVDPDLQPEAVVTPCSAILTFRPGAAASTRAAIVRDAGAALGHDLARQNAASALVPNERALRVLADDPDIEQIIPNRRMHIMAPPGACTPWPDCKNGDGGGDPPSNQETPSGVARIGADQATHSGLGIGVAIVDTGLDRNHTDLNIAAPCFNAFVAGDPLCQDDHSHGTHVGGIVAALDNDQDVVGVAPDAALYSVKVLDSAGFGSDADIVAGLNWILANAGSVNPPIKVVNMSLGEDNRDCGAAAWPSSGAAPDNPVLREAIQDLTAAGITVVVAAGNNRDLEVKDTVPAGCAEVIAVASTTAVDGNNKCKFLPNAVLADTASFFTTDGAFGDVQPSGKGIGVTISAPGEKQENLTCGSVQSEGILSLSLGGGTTRKSGTSMAAPHVAGVVALMLEANSALASEDVRAALRADADQIGTAPRDPVIGTPDSEQEGIVSASGL